MTKKKLRQDMLALLKAFPSADKKKADEQLIEQFIKTSIYQNAKTIATYLNFTHEFNTQLLITRALADGKNILIPKTYPRGKMIFCQYNPNRLTKNSFGLLEPLDSIKVSKDNIDIIHVPGLVFNPCLYRIGYGGGYYDRYLSTYQGSTISTIYSFQQRSFLAESHDIAVKQILIAN